MFYWCIYASLGLNELSPCIVIYPMQSMYYLLCIMILIFEFCLKELWLFIYILCNSWTVIMKHFIQMISQNTEDHLISPYDGYQSYEP